MEVATCPRCKGPIGLDDVSSAEERPPVAVMAMTCPSCSVSGRLTIALEAWRSLVPQVDESSDVHSKREAGHIAAMFGKHFLSQVETPADIFEWADGSPAPKERI